MKFLRTCVLTGMTAAMLVMPTIGFAQATPPGTTVPTTPTTQASNPVAAGLATAAGPTGLRNPCSGQDVRDCVASIIGNIVGVLLGFVEVILFLLFLYAGFLWMTAQGDPKQVEKAKGMLRDATIGLVVIGLSYLLTSFVVNTLSNATSAPTAAPITTTPSR